MRVTTYVFIEKNRKLFFELSVILPSCLVVCVKQKNDVFAFKGGHSIKGMIWVCIYGNSVHVLLGCFKRERAVFAEE